MIVIDAGVLVAALLGDGSECAAVRSRLRGERLAAPELIDLEVGSVARRLVRSGVVDKERAFSALHDLHDTPIQRSSHSALIARCWELRDNMTMYDASYVALAEALGVPLLTTDARLARSHGATCEFELVPA